MQAWIYDAVRTPRGKARPDGGLAALKPQELVGGLVDALQSRGHAAREVDALVLGCVGQLGDQGANVALVSKLHAGVADEAYAFTLNNYCVSGLTAIGQTARQIDAGSIHRALAGGVEMMSRVPFMGDSASYYTDSSFPRRTRYHSRRAGRRPARRSRRCLAAVARRGCARLAAARGRGRSQPGVDSFADRPRQSRAG